MQLADRPRKGSVILKPSLSRSTMLRTASAVLSMLVSAVVIAGTASAQSLPATELSTGGVDLTTGPEGVKVGVDAGDTGGVTVGAGPGGVDLVAREDERTPQRVANGAFVVHDQDAHASHRRAVLPANPEF